MLNSRETFSMRVYMHVNFPERAYDINPAQNLAKA